MKYHPLGGWIFINFCGAYVLNRLNQTDPSPKWNVNGTYFPAPAGKKLSVEIFRPRKIQPLAR